MARDAGAWVAAHGSEEWEASPPILSTNRGWTHAPGTARRLSDLTRCVPLFAAQDEERSRFFVARTARAGEMTPAAAPWVSPRFVERMGGEASHPS